jgi:hypothetical protein
LDAPDGEGDSAVLFEPEVEFGVHSGGILTQRRGGAKTQRFFFKMISYLLIPITLLEFRYTVAVQDS